MNVARQLKKITLDLKFAHAIREMALQAGVPNDDKAILAWSERYEQAIIDAFGIFPETVAERLTAFRKEVGEEMWASIALNPSLPKLVEDWTIQLYMGKIYSVQKKLKELFKDNTEITPEEVEQFVIYTLQHYKDED